MTLTTDNWNSPKYQPKATLAYISKIDEKKVKKFGLKLMQKTSDLFKTISTDYLVSVQLPPGKYKIREIIGMSGVFPVAGTFVLPLYSTFELEANEVVYIGHVEGIIRKRENDAQLRAGPLLPLIDQGITGFSTGTFEVTISDDYEEDMGRFVEKFPYMSDYTVKRRVMATWVQPTQADIKSKK